MCVLGGGGAPYYYLFGPTPRDCFFPFCFIEFGLVSFEVSGGGGGGGGGGGCVNPKLGQGHPRKPGPSAAAQGSQNWGIS